METKVCPHCKRELNISHFKRKYKSKVQRPDHPRTAKETITCDICRAGVSLSKARINKK